MNNLFLKTIVIPAALLASVGYTGIVSAHCRDGLTLPTSAGGADLYRVKCFTDPGADSPNPASKLFAKVQLQSATVVGQSVGLQIGKEGFTQSILVTDASFTAGDVTDPLGDESCTAPNASGQTALIPVPDSNGGNGDYNILVSKRGGSAKTYGLVFHCQDTAGAHTGTSEVVAGSAASELTGNSSLTPDIDLLINR